MAPAPAAEAAPKPPAHNAPGYLSWGLRGFAFIVASPGRFAIAQRLAGILSWPLAPISGWLRLPGFTGWGHSKDFPRPAVSPFRARWASRKSELAKTSEREIIEGGGPPIQETRKPAQPAREEGAQSSEPLVQFAKELTALGVVFTACATWDVGQRILDLLRDQDITAIQAWEAGQFPPGLLDTLQEGGIKILHEPDPSLQIGLTGALAGIAETGTLVLAGSPERPLTASLLPRAHIAVLRASDLCGRLPQALRLHEVQQAAAVALISGPSRTNDIEMTLTVGMHGPGKVYVFCLTDR